MTGIRFKLCQTWTTALRIFHKISKALHVKSRSLQKIPFSSCPLVCSHGASPWGAQHCRLAPRPSRSLRGTIFSSYGSNSHLLSPTTFMSKKAAFTASAVPSPTMPRPLRAPFCCEHPTEWLLFSGLSWDIDDLKVWSGHLLFTFRGRSFVPLADDSQMQVSNPDLSPGEQRLYFP